MTRLRRRPRAVYRVYGEEEYLAGVDALSAREDAPPSCECPSHEPAHGHRLQRIAGAAALTGAVGAVGGVAGLAGMRAHAPARARMLDRREIARRIAPAVRAAPLRAGASPPLHGARRRISRRLPSRHAHVGRARPVPVSHRSASREGAGARMTVFTSASRETAARVASTAPGASTETASTTPGAPAEVPSAASQTPSAPATARPAAQSEFGFER
jgi:hypothetical protein